MSFTTHILHVIPLQKIEVVVISEVAQQLILTTLQLAIHCIHEGYGVSEAEATISYYHTHCLNFHNIRNSVGFTGVTELP